MQQQMTTNEFYSRGHATPTARSSKIHRDSMKGMDEGSVHKYIEKEVKERYFSDDERDEEADNDRREYLWALAPKFDRDQKWKKGMSDEKLTMLEKEDESWDGAEGKASKKRGSYVPIMTKESLMKRQRQMERLNASSGVGGSHAAGSSSKMGNPAGYNLGLYVDNVESPVPAIIGTATTVWKKEAGKAYGLVLSDDNSDDPGGCVLETCDPVQVVQHYDNEETEDERKVGNVVALPIGDANPTSVQGVHDTESD